MRKIMGLLVFVAGGVGISFAVSQYLAGFKDERTEDKPSALASAVADAAHRIAVDGTSYAVEVAMRVGPGRIRERAELIAVVATIDVRGSSTLTDFCTSLPRVRDSINTVVMDRIRPRLGESQVKSDDLAADARIVLASLNRLLQTDDVTAVHLALKPTREAQDSGCSAKIKTANAARPD
jgi:hypothetical protein